LIFLQHILSRCMMWNEVEILYLQIHEYSVKEGEVKLQRANSSLSILGVGAIFGERISPPLLWTLFESDPQLGYRFYRWLAAKLCRRLLTYAQTGKPRGLRRTESVMWVKDDDDAKTVKRDLQFIQKFNLPPNEVLIKEYSCIVRVAQFKQNGHLYVASHYVGVFASLFGFRFKVRIFWKK
jgi:hypothetical protein